MLIIGTRGSQLALWQAHWVQARLQELGLESEIRIIKTTGDKITNVPLSQVGTKGLFTKELEDALLAREIDLAVHSLKDMPGELPDGMNLTAVPIREDARDAMVGLRLADLAQGAHVGTSSLRRAALLRARRPDLRIESIRGNLDTRLRKLDEGQFDAIVLAAAGLIRLGWANRIAESLDPSVMCPAVGQGALAVETLSELSKGHEAAKLLDHQPTRTAVTAERALLAAMGGGCQVPLGAHATLSDSRLHLRAIVISPDGRTAIERAVSGDPNDAANIGSALAQELLTAGAQQILESVYGSPAAS